MKNSWDLFAVLVWLPVFVVMSDSFGGAGSIVALLLLPLAWILWVNLRERWCEAEDRPEDRDAR